MDTLVELINSLSKAERKYLKVLLEAFGGRANENKMLDAVTLIEKNEQITHAELSKILYKDPQSKAFLVMKKRLITRVHEVILNAENIPNNQTIESNPVAFEYAHFIKQFSIALNLLKRGLSQQAKSHLEDECLHHPQAEFYPNFKLLVWEYYRNIVAPYFSREAYKKLEQQIQEIEKASAVAHKSQKMYDEFLMFRQLKNFEAGLVETKLSNYIAELSADIEVIPDIKTTYWVLYFQFYLDSFKRNEEAMQTSATQMLELNQQHPHLSDNIRKGVLFFQLMELAIKKCDFQNAYQYADQLRVLFANRIFNLTQVLKQKAVICFYMGKWEEINALFEQYQEVFNRLDSNVIRTYYYECIFACIAYLKGDVKEAYRLVINTENTADNKSKISSWLRILEIILLIEKQEFDLVEGKLENFRKFQSNNEIDGRIVDVYKILNKLMKDNFKFSQSREEIQKIIEKMNQNFAWEPYSLELIRFDVWYQSKVENRDYWEMFQALISY